MRKLRHAGPLLHLTSVEMKLRIYTDGNCPFCLWARRLVEPYDRDHRLEFRDFNNPVVAAETPFSFDELSRRMHVQTLDGNWHAGYMGWVAILRVLPRLRWLGWLMSIIPLRWVGPGLYDFIARNRYRIPDFLLRILRVPRPCNEACRYPIESRRV